MVRESLAQYIHCSQVDREFRVMSALFSVDFPVPRPLCLCTDNNVIGSHFYVMEKVNGRIFRHASFPGASPDERRLLYKSLVETLARLHSINWRAIGLAGYGGRSKKSYCERQVKYDQVNKPLFKERERETTNILMVFLLQVSVWSRNYHMSCTDGEPAHEMEVLMDWLPKNIPKRPHPIC